MGHMGKVLKRQYKGDWAAQWKNKAKRHAEVHESAGPCFRRVATSSSPWLFQSDQTSCRLQYLTLFHNSVPLTVGRAIPRWPLPLFTLVPIISPRFTWNNPHTETPFAFSLFQQRTVCTHITTTTPLIIETAYLLGLSSWSQGAWFLILTPLVSHTVPGTLETQKTMFACVLIKAVLIAVRPNG